MPSVWQTTTLRVIRYENCTQLVIAFKCKPMRQVFLNSVLVLLVGGTDDFNCFTQVGNPLISMGVVLGIL